MYMDPNKLKGGISYGVERPGQPESPPQLNPGVGRPMSPMQNMAGGGMAAGGSLFQELAKRAQLQQGGMKPMTRMQPLSGGMAPNLLPGPVPGQDGGLAPPGPGPRIDNGSIDRPMPEPPVLGGGMWQMPKPMGGSMMQSRPMPPQTSRFGYGGSGLIGSMLGDKQAY